MMLLATAGMLSLASCVADAPPTIGLAVAGENQATLSWTAPIGDTGLEVVGYKVTPYVGTEAKTPTIFNSTATTQVIPGLVSGTTYTFVVQGIGPLGSESASSAQSNPITPARPKATAISTAYRHSCVRLTDGTAMCWGYNEFGELGNGTWSNATTPGYVVVPTTPFPSGHRPLTSTTTVAAGFAHSCAALASGTVACWGSNEYGQLGDGTLNESVFPRPVVTISGATATSAGFTHSCAIVTGGAIKCWGRNQQGQLGNGTTVDSSVPVSVTGITGATALASGANHSCAVVAGGAIRCWGSGYRGELGDGTAVASSTPVPVSGVSGAIAVAAGYDGASCAVLASGSVKCWGNNSWGTLGNGTTTSSSTPVSVSGIHDATGVAIGTRHACAVSAGGAVRCWGDNGSAQIGDGTTTASTVPVLVTGVVDAAAVTVGEDHSCALRTTGTVSCWGANSHGQLGNGTTVDSATPTVVAGW